MKTFKTVISLLLAFVLSVMPVMAEEPAELSGEHMYMALGSVSSYIEIYYKFGADADKLMNVAFREKLNNPDADIEDMIRAMMATLDKHSEYLTEEDYQALIEQSILGTFCGIGVSIMEVNGKVIVVSPIEGGSAEKAGIRPNDIIFYVNGENVTGKSISYIQSLILGEEGTDVNVGFIREGQPVYYNLKRTKVKNPTVSHSIIDGVGYIKVSSFNVSTPEDTKIALSEFDRKGIKNIVIDLRDNPGGEINSVAEFANNFIPEGILSTIEYNEHTGNKQVLYSKNKHPKYKLAVLINENSASASELFTAAVIDTKAGRVFGTTSYGKGTMQQVQPYALTGGGIKLTIAEFKSPLGNSINGVGVNPDMTVYNGTETRDASHLLPFDITVKNKRGDVSENVMALEQRLQFLEYFEGEPDETFDNETFEALKTYQAYQGLSINGVTDIDTAISLNSIDYENLKFFDDIQLETAINSFK